MRKKTRRQGRPRSAWVARQAVPDKRRSVPNPQLTRAGGSRKTGNQNKRNKRDCRMRGASVRASPQRRQGTPHTHQCTHSLTHTAKKTPRLRVQGWLQVWTRRPWHGSAHTQPLRGHSARSDWGTIRTLPPRPGQTRARGQSPEQQQTLLAGRIVDNNVCKIVQQQHSTGLVEINEMGDETRGGGGIGGD